MPSAGRGMGGIHLLQDFFPNRWPKRRQGWGGTRTAYGLILAKGAVQAARGMSKCKFQRPVRMGPGQKGPVHQRKERTFCILERVTKRGGVGGLRPSLGAKISYRKGALQGKKVKIHKKRERGGKGSNLKDSGEERILSAVRKIIRRWKGESKEGQVKGKKRFEIGGTKRGELRERERSQFQKTKNRGRGRKGVGGNGQRKVCLEKNQRRGQAKVRLRAIIET